LSERSLYIGLLASLLFHGLASLALFKAGPALPLLTPTEHRRPADNIDLTLIENPDNNLKPDPTTRFLSREDSRAAGRLTERRGQNEWLPKQTGLKQAMQSPASGDGPATETIEFEKTESGIKLPEYYDFNQERAFRVDSDGSLSFDTRKYENADYFLRLVAKVSRRWHDAIPVTAHYMGLIPTGDVKIVLLIARDGTLLEHRVVQDFHYPSMTRAAEYAVTAAAPYEPLPDSVKEPAATIPIIFRYVGR
jgi:outer membrane biosynthesis protein TonB